MSNELTYYRPPQKAVLHAYQKKALKFLLDNQSVGLFMKPGLGKTLVTLLALKKLMAEGQIYKTLIIAPPWVCHNVWAQEIKKWTQTFDLRIEIITGTKKEQALEREADIYIINPESLKWLIKPSEGSKNGKKKYFFTKEQQRRWLDLGFDTLVIDELSAFKAHNTLRFDLMKLILDTFTRRWGLTGSPASNGLLDLFGECYMLDSGQALGKYITHYRMNYFDSDYSGYNWTVKPGKEKEIYEAIKPLVFQLQARDYLELPVVVNNVVNIELPPKVRKLYDEFEENLIAEIDSKLIVAGTAAIKSSRCRQIASGGIYMEPDLTITGFQIEQKKNKKKDWMPLHDAKGEALEALVNELNGEPLLVAYEFNHDLERLKERFGKDLPYIGGGVNVKEGQKIVADWNAGKLPLLAGQPQSMALGLNLQGCGQHICWYTLTWNYQNYDQLIQRLVRQGNKHSHVFVHHLIAENTVESLVIEALKNKEYCQESLFDGLKKLAQQRKRK